MMKIVTDLELRDQMASHSRKALHFFQRAEELRQDALRLSFNRERFLTMQNVIDLQKLAIQESEAGCRIEKILYSRQRKTMSQQLDRRSYQEIIRHRLILGIFFLSHILNAFS